MRRKIGTFIMIIGALLVAGAIGLLIYNTVENMRAGVSVEKILPQVKDVTDNADGEPDASDTEMTEVEIDGYMYIGYISIPAIEIELPVMSTWSYPQLKIAPCRYYGSTKTDNLVIAAHNYARHFGKIKNLSIGDNVYFTDMDGVVWSYKVADIETLAPTAIEDMTAGEYALTLYTCTYGGKSRVTVRCDRVE